MDKEIRALLKHAAYCRRIAAETAHDAAAGRLEQLAIEYESRARKLAQASGRLDFIASGRPEDV